MANSNNTGNKKNQFQVQILEFNNVNEAFISLFDLLLKEGEKRKDTLTLFEQVIHIKYPLERETTVSWRKWSLDYAKAEVEWYWNGNRNAEYIAQRAKIWYKHMDENGNVNSNYGNQWFRGNQLAFVISELHKNKNSRRAGITLYDGKENHLHALDTPCTMSILFYIRRDELYASVNMRSNDLWFGFPNDVYTFVDLMIFIASELKINVGSYHHHVTNLHLYKRHWNKKVDYHKKINHELRNK